MIRSEIATAEQQGKERASTFGQRLEFLLNEAEEFIKKAWNSTEVVSALSEYRRLVTNKFIFGVRVPYLQNRLEGFKDKPLVELIKLAEESEDLHTKNSKKSYLNYFVTQTFPTPPQKIRCSFCNIEGHTQDICETRKNRPYCSICAQYGHVFS